MPKTDTSAKGLETLIMRHLSMKLHPAWIRLWPGNSVVVASYFLSDLTARNHIHCNPEAMHPASQHNPSNRADIRKVPTPPNGHVARRRE